MSEEKTTWHDLPKGVRLLSKIMAANDMELQELAKSLALAGLEITPIDRWEPIETVTEGETVDLWAQERERYEHDRIPDCVYQDGAWRHQQTVFDSDALANDAGFVEVLCPTHWTYRPSKPLTKGQ